MKKIIVLGLVFSFLAPSIVFGQANDLRLFDNRTVDRSIDLQRKGDRYDATLSRAQRIYNSRKAEANKYNDQTKKRIQWNVVRAPETFEVKRRAYSPWATFHYKNRLRMAFRDSDRKTQVYKKPIIEAKTKTLDYYSKGETRYTLDGERSGTRKARNLDFNRDFR